MTPKSLLRNPKVVSPIEELATGCFQPIIDDPNAIADRVERLVMCSGKLYYELISKKEELHDEKTAIVRLEQLYPLQSDKIDEIFKKYSDAKEFIWVQEEPENMGAWSYILRNFRNKNPKIISPVASGVPAPGSHKRFEIDQAKLVNSVFYD